LLFRGLKTNMAINIALVLLIGMLLIDLVAIMTFQKYMIKSEIYKGYMLINAITDNYIALPKQENMLLDSDFKYFMSSLINKTDCSLGLLMDISQRKIYFEKKSCNFKNELESMTKKAIDTKKVSLDFFGSTWGVLWKQSQNFIVSAPLYKKGKIYAGVSVVYDLYPVYEKLRHIQQIIFIYIFINTIILTFIGLQRLFMIYIRPVQRLVNRSYEYKDDNEIFFSVRKEDSELNQLSTALNNMLKRISEDKEKLFKTVKYLEKVNLELKQVQKEIINAEKLASVGRLSSGIAHEIGNPLGIVIGYLDLLKQKDIPDDEKHDFILRVEDEIFRINHIIRQLIDLSRPSKDELKKVSVNEIIKDLYSILRSQPLFSDIDIKLNLTFENDNVLANHDKLRQVFLNIILNSADAISSLPELTNGEILIFTNLVMDVNQDSEDNVSMLKIVFKDNGTGISKDDFENIFDPFYTTKEPGKGTGLGLYVSFMIIEGFGGNIKASGIEGSGTIITVLLPLVR